MKMYTFGGRRHSPMASARLLWPAWMAVLMLVIGCDLLELEEPIDFLTNPYARVFRGRLTYPTGEAPYEALTGDLNGNGMTDIVTLNWETQTASVLLADGAGGYDAPKSYELGASPRAAVLADLTGNAILDLAVVDEEHAQVIMMYGDGQGAFGDSTVIHLASGARPLGIAVADLSNNGALDLITADSGAATVTLLVNEGGGSFLEPLSIPVEHAPVTVWAGDLNGNGIADIVTANAEEDTLTILEGTGAGYLPPLLLSCGYMPHSVVGVDLNNSGRRDLVVGNAGSGDISVLYALEDGQFAEEKRLAFPQPVGRFIVADLTGNTIPDIAAVLFDGVGDERQPLSRFAVMRGDGTGAFSEAEIYGAGWGALAIAAADLNNNGRLDLLTPDYVTDTVSIAYNGGNAKFESDRRFSVGKRPEAALVADFTDDGIKDMAVMNVNDNSISVLAGRGDGSFDALSPIMLPGKPLAMAAGDLNGNGKQDMVVTISAQTRVLVYVGDGNGRFTGPHFFAIQTDHSRGAPEALSVAVGDVNNSGSLDIVTGNSKTDSVSVLLNDGAGTFAPPIVSAVSNYPRCIHLVDTNDNGLLDLVLLSSRDPDSASDSAEPRVVRWFGNGDGTFDADTHLRFATGSAPSKMAMADITGNGRLDAVTLHPGDNSVRVLAGLKNGNFATATRVFVGYQPMSTALADVNRNGRADLVVTLNSGSVITRFSREELKFEGPNNFIVSKGMSGCLLHDFTGDGNLDLVVLGITRNDIGVLRGATP